MCFFIVLILQCNMNKYWQEMVLENKGGGSFLKHLSKLQ